MTCHHSTPSRERINHLTHQIERYRELTREIFTAAPGSPLSESRVGTALRMGDDLIDKVELIVNVTSANLEKQERGILRNIQERKISSFPACDDRTFFCRGSGFFPDPRVDQALDQPAGSHAQAEDRRSGSQDQGHCMVNSGKWRPLSMTWRHPSKNRCRSCSGRSNCGCAGRWRPGLPMK